MFADELRRWDIKARVLHGQKGGGEVAVRIHRVSDHNGDEAYRLRITSSIIEIYSSTASGAYYAIQTLRELVGHCGRAIPVCDIKDWPTFRRRGVYHDISRGKVPTLTTLKNLIERLASWKINELQLYVENVFRFRRYPQIGYGYSPLSADDIAQLQDHCRLHHVRFVGSMASFGHMEKILALKSFQHLGELSGFRGWPGGTTLCPTDPGSIKLVQEMYEEYLPLFQVKDFNICGDEPWELGKGRSAFRADRVGVGRVYLEYFRKVCGIARKLGKRVNAWADILLEHPDFLHELPRGLVMLNWEYHPTGPRITRTGDIVRAGLPVLVCPGTNAWNSHGCRLQMGMRNISRFALEGQRCDAEGLLNTDWGDNGHRNTLAVSLHNLAWGAAHSWNPQASRSEKFRQTFTERFWFHTFGGTPSQIDRGAAALRRLGSAHESLKLPLANNTVLYNTLVPMREKIEALQQRVAIQLSRVKIADLISYRNDLGTLRWPLCAGSSEFERVRIEEFKLATRMERLACARAIVLKKWEISSHVSTRELNKLVDQTRELIDDLQRIWLLANRPSRLRDQLAGLRHSLSEYRVNR